MGGNISQEEQEARLRSFAIDKELRQNAKEWENTIKIIVLGAGESGKGTLIKQIKIIHGDVNELNHYKSTIHSNLLAAMVSVVKAMNKLRIPLGDQSIEEHISALLAFSIPLCLGDQIPPELKESLKVIIHDRGFQQCFHRAYEYELYDNAPYYFQEMERILDPEYTPNEQDVLRSYVRTSGIMETSCIVGQIIYRLVDTGGARSQRRKWIQCFDDVKAVIFIAALNGYDMTLWEDGTTNRLEESLNLFQTIHNNKFLVKASMILLLNKMDLFEEKIMRSVRHLRLYFPEYTGPDRNVEAAAKFIQDKFQARNLNKDKPIHSHFITATDTDNIKVVVKLIFETIIRENLQAVNLL